MAVNVLLTCGVEAGSWNYYVAQGWTRNGNPARTGVDSSTSHKTLSGRGGTYSFFNETSLADGSPSLSSPHFDSSARWLHCWLDIHYTGASITAYRRIAFLGPDGSETLELRFYLFERQIRIYRGGTLLASSVSDVFRYSSVATHDEGCQNWLSVYAIADNSVGVVKVYLNGAEVVSYTGNTQNSNLPGWNRVRWGAAGFDNSWWYIDDIIVTDDDSGTALTPMPEVYGQALVPVEVVSGTMEGNPVTGPERYQNVASIPWNPESYNVGDVPGSEDVYAFGGDYEDLGGDVMIVSVNANAFTEGTLTNAEIRVDSGSSSTYGDPIPTPSSPETISFARHFIENPDGGNWTVPAVAAIKAGVRVT